MMDKLVYVTLCGGRPWGFTLGGGREIGLPLYIAAIDPGGKLSSCKQLLDGDYVVSINEKPVWSHHDAVKRILQSSETLTLGVNTDGRGHTSSPVNGDAGSDQGPVFIRRTDTPGRSQDDMVVLDSKQREHATRRPKRRGASFNLRSTSHTTPWQPPSDDVSPATSPQYGGPQLSLSSADLPSNHVKGSLHSGQNRLYGMKSTPSLQYYSQSTNGYDPMITTPPGVVPPSQSWHSGLTSGDNSTGETANAEGGGYLEQPQIMKKSLSYSSAPGRGFGQYDNLGPFPYRNALADVENKENHSNRGHSDHDVSRAYKSGYSGPNANMPWQSGVNHPRNYENVDALEYKSGYYSEIKGNHHKSDSRDSGLGGTGSTPTESYRIDDYYKDNRPISPPMPPMHDASSNIYSKTSQHHEKYPSWPVTQGVPTITSAEHTTSHSTGANTRTRSWTENSQTNTEFPNKPRMAYQPQLNTHVEERMSPETMRRYFMEKRLKTPKDQFNERVATELKGEDFDLKKSFPMDSKGKIDVNKLRSSDPSYPLPNVDRDGHYSEDKNYAIPSPPQRDISPPRSGDNRKYGISHQYSGSLDQSYNRQSSPPPPLPDNSPPYETNRAGRLSTGSYGNNSSYGLQGSFEASDKTSPSTQSTQYPYVIRQRAFYNTSTQTDSKNAEVQVDDIPSQASAKNRREEKSVQARYGSIVSHLHKQEAQTESDYERLIFTRDPGHSVNTGSYSDAGTSPGPYSPRDHRAQQIVDHIEPRIPETIKENIESAYRPHTATFAEDVMAKIQEHDNDDTVMLRRLSQDFFRNQQSRTSSRELSNQSVPSVNLKHGRHSNEPSFSQMSTSSSSTEGNSHSRQGSNSDYTGRANFSTLHSSRPTSLDDIISQSQQNLTMVPANQCKRSGLQNEQETAENEDQLEDLPTTPSNISFDRNKTANMSLRKAYGLFDDGLTDGKSLKFNQNARSSSASQMLDFKSEGKKTKKSRRSHDPSEMRETKIIAEKARKDWEKSGKMQEQGLGKLKRATSEQIKPLREKEKRVKSPSRLKLSEPTEQISPGQTNANLDPHRYSDSKDAQKAQDFLCNSPLSHQRRMGSDSDNVFVLPPGSSQPTGQVINHSRYSSSNRSASSTGGSFDEHSRNSDPELKKLQQNALLNYYDKKAIHLSASDGGDKSPSRENISPGFRNQSPSTHPDYITPKGQKDQMKEGRKVSNVLQSPIGNDYDMPTPVLLDTTKDLSPMKTGASSFNYPGSLEYSPPLHPWKQEQEQTTRSQNSPGGMTNLMAQSPLVSAVPSLTKGQNEETKMAAVRPDSLSRNVSDDQTHPKAIEAAQSSGHSPTMTGATSDEMNKKYSYQVTVNQSYTQDEDDKPPVLPPRNYRSSDRLKGRPIPEPRQHTENNNMTKHVSQVSVSQSRPPVPEPRTCQDGLTQKHVSQVSVSFNSEYDATPKADSYADQLRQQARRFSQSQSSLLSAARYQPKVLPELKTNVSVSRPVETPRAQEAGPPLTSSATSSNNERPTRLSDPQQDSRNIHTIKVVSQGIELHSPVEVREFPKYSSKWESGSSHVEIVNSPKELTFAPVTVITKQSTPNSTANRASISGYDPLGSVDSPNIPGSRSSLGTTPSERNLVSSPHSQNPNNSYSPSYNTHTSMNISSVSQSHLTQSPVSVSSPVFSESAIESSSSFNSSSSTLDVTTSPQTDNHVEVIKAPRAKPVVLEKKKKKKREAKSSPPKSKHLKDLVASEVMTPPPPPPPKYATPDHRMIDKPLPPPPPDVLDLNNGDADCDDSPTSRYTSESYMSKRGTTRTGFGGNYRRSGESSPNTSFSPGVSTSDTNSIPASSEMHTARHQGSKSITVTKVTESVSPLRPLNKPHSDLPWAKRALYSNGSHIPMTPAGQLSQQSTESAPPGEEIVEDSPSVRACIANFENWSPHSQRKFNQTAVGKTKVVELRETLLRRSNENLADLDNSPPYARAGSQGSLSSRSQSNESLDDRLCLSQSTENISNALPTDRKTSKAPFKKPARQLKKESSSDQHLRDRLALSSPTLESGYNSHNTPDNRSIVSELSLSSHGSGSLSIPSRNGSNVSKESIELPPAISQSVTVVHVRQKSMEELECDHQAALLVNQLPVDEKRKLSDVILPPPEHKTTTDYMCGLFDTQVESSRRHSSKGSHSKDNSLDNSNSDVKYSTDCDVPVSSTYWSPPSVAQLQNRMHQDRLRTDDMLCNHSNSLGSQKVELIARIEKKLQILNKEKTNLEQEVDENNTIGQQIMRLVEEKAPNRHDFNKFKIYLEELDTVLKLLLKVSGQLARAENAVMSIPEDSPDTELVALKAKRDDLFQKHEDAKQLKEGIDLRSHQVASCLKKCLTAEENTEFEYFIKMKSKLKLEQQEIEDKISLGEEQLSALRKTL